MGRKVVWLHDVFHHFVSRYPEASLPAIQGVILMVWISLTYRISYNNESDDCVSRVGSVGSLDKMEESAS